MFSASAKTPSLQPGSCVDDWAIRFGPSPNQGRCFPHDNHSSSFLETMYRDLNRHKNSAACFSQYAIRKRQTKILDALHYLHVGASSLAGCRDLILYPAEASAQLKTLFASEFIIFFHNKSEIEHHSGKKYFSLLLHRNSVLRYHSECEVTLPVSHKENLTLRTKRAGNGTTVS